MARSGATAHNLRSCGLEKQEKKKDRRRTDLLGGKVAERLVDVDEVGAGLGLAPDAFRRLALLFDGGGGVAGALRRRCRRRFDGRRRRRRVAVAFGVAQLPGQVLERTRKKNQRRLPVTWCTRISRPGKGAIKRMTNCVRELYLIYSFRLGYVKLA